LRPPQHFILKIGGIGIAGLKPSPHNKRFLIANEADFSEKKPRVPPLAAFLNRPAYAQSS